MAYFDFKRLITKYTTEFTVKIPSEGHYDDAGDWVSGEPVTVKKQGAIISLTENKIFKSEGTLTAQDRALYMLEPINLALKGAEVIHGNRVYTISDSLQNAEFTCVYAYTLKFVSVFGGGINA